MTIETISLSDIGKSLLEIEQEIAANNNSIGYYNESIAKMEAKNTALRDLAGSILKSALPLTLKQNKW